MPYGRATHRCVSATTSPPSATKPSRSASEGRHPGPYRMREMHTILKYIEAHSGFGSAGREAEPSAIDDLRSKASLQPMPTRLDERTIALRRRVWSLRPGDDEVAPQQT